MFPTGQPPPGWQYSQNGANYPNAQLPNAQNTVALVQPMSFPHLPLTAEQEYMALQQKHYYDRLLLVQQQSRELAAAGLVVSHPEDYDPA